MKQLFILTALVLLVASCTQNQRAKSFGGEAKLEVPCGQKVTNITWKEDELWFSTTPMEADYTPRVHTFREESSFGIIKGSYLLTETRCK